MSSCLVNWIEGYSHQEADPFVVSILNVYRLVTVKSQR